MFRVLEKPLTWLDCTLRRGRKLFKKEMKSEKKPAHPKQGFISESEETSLPSNKMSLNEVTETTIDRVSRVTREIKLLCTTTPAPDPVVSDLL